MANVHYRIVEHEGGWACKAGDVFSERYATHDEARLKTSSTRTKRVTGTKKSLAGRTGQRQTSRDERSGTARRAGS
ncbi:hypothetical protein [Microvirga tunisiensis]|jgi:hypothetical protein|uniref:hypothetical protein n=1 Tax=Microvirga tunisiensis TaxID=2108360 RepID=UPI003B84A5B6